ncbi:hypothetical protein JCM18237_11810 [Halorubrum luteum]
MPQFFVLLLKFINAVFEGSDPLKQLLHFLISNHQNPPRLVQKTRDGLPAGDRPSGNTLSSALLYYEVRGNLRESGEIVLGVNTYLISNHQNPPRLVQKTRDGLPAGDRPSGNTLSSALLYYEVRGNLRESGEIVLGVNTYG